MKRKTWKGKVTAILFICCMACLMRVGMPEVKAATYDDYEYEENEDGSVSITGYTGEDDEISIPNEIDGKAVTSIGNRAFEHCFSLTNIVIPNSVTSIGFQAFFECVSLTSIEIPNSVTSIDCQAFCCCYSLTSIVIPNSVTSIDDLAFSFCDSLSSIVVESGNEKYDSRNDCNAIIETATNTLIIGCEATSIPNNVTSIGNGAFAQSNLTSIVIPNSVTSIGGYAFQYCFNLTSIKIPSSVTSIEDSTFWGCSDLTSIDVESDNKTYDSRDNCNAIIETATNTLIAGCKATTIPNSVTSISRGAFNHCFNLTSIKIPSSVTSIGNGAFGGCSNLTSIVVESENKTYDSRKNCNAIIETATNTLIAGCKATIIPNSITSIGSSAFWGCYGLSSIVIPNSVTSIGDSAFVDCSSLSSIVIPNSVTSIGDSAFWICSNLTSIVIPSSVTNIGYNIFDNCNPNMIVYADANSDAAEYAKKAGFTVKPISDYDSESTPGDKEPQKPDKPNTPQTPVQNTPTQNTPVKDTPAKDTPTQDTPAKTGTVLETADAKCTVKVTSDVSSNPTVAYTGVTNAKASTVNVPDTVTVDGVTYTVTSIADNAFANNKKLKKVTTGKNVTSIGKNAFKKCTALKSVEIKSTSLNKIGANAFNGAKNLKTVTIKSTKLTQKSIGKNALKGTNKNLVIKVPKKKVTAYSKYFKGKGNKSVKVKK